MLGRQEGFMCRQNKQGCRRGMFLSSFHILSEKWDQNPFQVTCGTEDNINYL